MKTLIQTSRAELTEALRTVGYPVTSHLSPNSQDESLVIQEATPFVTQGQTLGTVDIHYQVYGFIKPSLDTNEVVKRLDEIAGKVLSAIWFESEIELDSYTTVSTEDGKHRFAAKFNITVTYSIERDE